MMKQILTILSLTALMSCSYISELKRTGEEKTIDIEWVGASEIEIWAPVRLVLSNSDEPQLQLTGMDFIVEGYRLSTENNKLIIRHRDTNILQDSKIAKLYVSAPLFSRITSNSPSQISSGGDTLNIEKLALVVNGKGIYTTGELCLKGKEFSLAIYGGINKSQHFLKGKVERASYHLEGGSDIYADELLTESSSVTHKSYGDTYLHATSHLKVSIFSTGNVYYSGNPELNVERIENTLMTATGNAIISR